MSEQDNTKREILVVDDSATILATAKKMLGDQYVIQTAQNGAEAWEMIQQDFAIAMVFSDIQMPVMNGMELLLKIRESEDSRIANLPVVLITGELDTPAGKRAAFDIGATDFIGKPFNTVDLVTRARAHIGDPNTNRRRASDIEDDGNLHMLSPRGFHGMGCQILEFAFEQKTEFTVVYIELTNYKEIEKVVGERNIKHIFLSLARRIKGAMREEDAATRIGENRFAVLFNTHHANAEKAVERLCDHMNNLVFEFNNEKLKTTLIYGYANSDCYNKDLDFSEICSQAEASLKSALSGEQIAVSPTGALDDIRTEGREKTIDLWSSLKYIADGDYHLVPEAHANDLVVCMRAYLDHVGKPK